MFFPLAVFQPSETSNHAEYGNDVYTNSGFQMDATLETLQALYADEEITEKGWKSTSIMDGGNEFFGMYLDPPKTETPTDQSGTGQNGNQQTPSDSNAGNTSTTDNSDRSDQSDNSDHSSYSTVTNNDNSDRSTVTNNHYASALQLSDLMQQIQKRIHCHW